ncbi:DUF2752 domain-containing protein [Adhaeribacter radiodurans]|uniref:DUF2752 domain-containing protein n=1 Tax=Adhaeribacter radiodurans TaxID=2745197 RepID=A0A7L7L553_9BACT|nr:DUF2752 domain-containing protein [Adhaeribacter radiodurans]QMU27725.1 DUF2752 domain-containing protein [Adhaeribacter radiodurans]
MTSSHFRRILSYGKISGYILIPIILLLLPANQFDTGTSLCLSKLLLDTECYGCGMMRAIMHLIHLDFSAALNFNKLSIIVFPLLSYLWAQSFLREVAKHRKYRRV